MYELVARRLRSQSRYIRVDAMTKRNRKGQYEAYEEVLKDRNRNQAATHKSYRKGAFGSFE